MTTSFDQAVADQLAAAHAMFEALQWIATVDKNLQPMLSAHSMVAIAIDAINAAAAAGIKSEAA